MADEETETEMTLEEAQAQEHAIQDMSMELYENIMDLAHAFMKEHGEPQGETGYLMSNLQHAAMFTGIIRAAAQIGVQGKYAMSRMITVLAIQEEEMQAVIGGASMPGNLEDETALAELLQSWVPPTGGEKN